MEFFDSLFSFSQSSSSCILLPAKPLTLFLVLIEQINSNVKKELEASLVQWFSIGIYVSKGKIISAAKRILGVSLESAKSSCGHRLFLQRWHSPGFCYNRVQQLVIHFHWTQFAKCSHPIVGRARNLLQVSELFHISFCRCSHSSDPFLAFSQPPFHTSFHGAHRSFAHGPGAVIPPFLK